jgi:hypothetical protein
MIYNLYTGFVKNVNPKKYANKSSQEFFDLWYDNTRRCVNIDVPIYLLGPDVPDLTKTINTEVIGRYENLGHVDDYVYGLRTGKWCGWTAAIVLGMAHAYACNKDFIYKEQDCLGFGDYVGSMYRECEGFDIVYGSCRIMGAAQSLFIVKRNSIPSIISYLAQHEDGFLLPELKFATLPLKQRRLSFGYDRDRPFNHKDPVFYIQQVSDSDLQQLKNNNLV